MMMRKGILLSLCFLLLSTVAAHAQPNIAVFNAQKLATESKALEDAKATLDKKFGPQKAELEKQRVSLEKKAAAIKGKPSEKQQAELSKLHRQYTEKSQAFVRVLQGDELRIRQEIDALIVAAAKKVAADKGYTLILDASAVVFVEPNADITALMLETVNALWEEGKKAPKPAENGKPDDSAKKDAKGGK